MSKPIWGCDEEGHRTFLGIRKVIHPTDPQSLYIHVMFRTFFLGQFADEQAVANAITTLDKVDPYWDYDCFTIHYGANPLPDDYVGGFRYVGDEARTRIMNIARPSGKLIVEQSG